MYDCSYVHFRSAVGGKGVLATRKGVLVCGKRCWCMEGGAGEWKGAPMGGKEVLVTQKGCWWVATRCWWVDMGYWWVRTCAGGQNAGLGLEVLPALACCGLHWPVSVSEWV